MTSDDQKLVELFDQACMNNEGRRVSWQNYFLVDRANVLRLFLRAVSEHATAKVGSWATHAEANHNGRFMPLTASYDLPEGYRMGSDGRSFWPLCGVDYVNDKSYATAAEAECAAWKHAYEKQYELLRDIRDIALRAL
jgi:hypothetical protein